MLSFAKQSLANSAGLTNPSKKDSLLKALKSYALG